MKQGQGGNPSFPITSLGSDPMLYDGNNKTGCEPINDSYHYQTQPNRHSISLSCVDKELLDGVLQNEERESIGYGNLTLLQSHYNPPLQSSSHLSDVNGRTHQFNSIDNIYVDPYIQEGRSSFSIRNQPGIPYTPPYTMHTIPSVGIFPQVREPSQSVEWGRPSLHLVGSDILHNEENEKKEGLEKKRSESSSLGNMFSINKNHSPLPFAKDDHTENRKSNLSVTDLDLSLLRGMTPPLTIPPHPLSPIPLNSVHGIVKETSQTKQDDKKRIKKEKNRESARLSRKRKKQYQQLLDNKVAEVLTELEREKTSRLETIQSSYHNLVHECAEAATQNEESYRQLIDILGPMNVEILEGYSFLWKELKSLSCPFYHRFILWIMSRDSLFFSRYKECLETSSGCKIVSKESSHSPSDFTGAFSFWPQFVSYFNLSPEQEARIRQMCLSECQRMITQSSKNAQDITSMRINRALTLLEKFKSFISDTIQTSDSLYQYLKQILSPQQFLTLLRYYQDPSLYEKVDLKNDVLHMQSKDAIPFVLCSPSTNVTIERMYELLCSV